MKPEGSERPTVRVFHEFGPFYRSDSEILILGSFPSVKSREQAFYYAHPQNRFWRVLAGSFGDSVPESLPEKQALLMRRRIALWDVIESCEIRGSSDSSIKNAVPTDVSRLLAETSVKRIILNGKTAERLFWKFHSELSVPTVSLPSTSPANASFTLERLIKEWRPKLLV